MSKKQIIRFAFIIILLLILYSVSGVVATCQAETKSDVLFLREALVMGIERNLDLKITELNVPIRKEGITVNRLPDDFLPLFLEQDCYKVHYQKEAMG